MLCSSALYVNFRLFESWNVDRLQVISVNYFVCILLGYGFSANEFSISQQDFFSPWALLAFALGGLFLANFFLTSLTVEKEGLPSASVATKISLVIPFVFSLVAHQGEGFHLLSLIGLVFSGLAIWFVSGPESSIGSGKIAWLPIAVFAGTGLTDVLSQWGNEILVPQSKQSVFVFLVFVGAFLASLVGLALRQTEEGKALHPRTMLAGFVLGVPNYFSYLFLLKALDSFDNQGNIVFPAGNLGVILVTGFVAVLLFKDALSKRKLLGIAFSILSLVFLFIPVLL